jgi:hypothetical protein
MSDKELYEYIEQMKKYTEKVKADKKLSLEVLVKAGVCNKDGQLETIYK